MVEVIRKGQFNKCLLEGYTGWGGDKCIIYRHFCFRHPIAKVTIKEVGELIRCDLCGIFSKNMGKHITSKTYKFWEIRGGMKKNRMHKEKLKGSIFLKKKTFSQNLENLRNLQSTLHIQDFYQKYFDNYWLFPNFDGL